MTEKKQLAIIWISAIVLFVLLVIVTIIVNIKENDANAPVNYLVGTNMNSILQTDKVYAQQDAQIQGVFNEKLNLFKTINISNVSEFEELAADINIQIDESDCYENICAWWSNEKLENLSIPVIDYFSLDRGYQKINMYYKQGIPLEKLGLDLEMIDTDPSILPETILTHYIGVNSEYEFDSIYEYDSDNTYTYNRIIEGKKLYMLSSADYSDFVTLVDDKIVSFSLHIFSFNSDRAFYKVKVDQDKIDNILLSKSDVITFVTQSSKNVNGEKQSAITDQYETLPVEIPAPSTCRLSDYEIGYYLNTSTSEKTLVPIYRGTCIGNTQYEGEEYIVNGLVMFELF